MVRIWLNRKSGQTATIDGQEMDNGNYTIKWVDIDKYGVVAPVSASEICDALRTINNETKSVN